jgi:hypothetical protein
LGQLLNIVLGEDEELKEPAAVENYSYYYSDIDVFLAADRSNRIHQTPAVGYSTAARR